MNNSTVLLLFPITVAVIMLGLGLTLTVADFHRVVKYPRAMVVCLVCQMLVLPAICLGLVVGFGLRPELAIGMMLRARFAIRMERPVKVLSVVVLAVMIGSVISGLGEEVFEILGDIILVVVLFNLSGMAIGYFGPRLLKVGPRESIASAFEIGLHNAPLSIAIAMSPTLLDSTEMAMPSVTYGFVMFFTALVFGLVVARRAPAPTADRAVTPSGT
ncbi:bile acid:sodium symporter family protein [Actinosynnema sp. NPDC091369]